MQRTVPSLPKPVNDMTEIVVVSLLSNLDRSHTQCNASSIHPEQKFMCIVDVQLILKMLGEMKRSILNVNLKKYPRRFSTP